MNAQAISIIVHARRERLGGTLAVSAAMHVLLFLLLVGYTTLASPFGGSWGKNWGSGRSTRIGAVASLPGVPLPAPMLTTHNTLASDNPGLHQTEPQPRPSRRPRLSRFPSSKSL